jgi:hypothetical protein
MGWSRVGAWVYASEQGVAMSVNTFEEGGIATLSGLKEGMAARCAQKEWYIRKNSPFFTRKLPALQPPVPELPKIRPKNPPNTPILTKAPYPNLKGGGGWRTGGFWYISQKDCGAVSVPRGLVICHGPCIHVPMGAGCRSKTDLACAPGTRQPLSQGVPSAACGGQRNMDLNPSISGLLAIRSW